MSGARDHGAPARIGGDKPGKRSRQIGLGVNVRDHEAAGLVAAGLDRNDNRLILER
jgi:hypothetical protein